MLDVWPSRGNQDFSECGTPPIAAIRLPALVLKRNGGALYKLSERRLARSRRFKLLLILDSARLMEDHV